MWGLTKSLLALFVGTILADVEFVDTEDKPLRKKDKTFKLQRLAVDAWTKQLTDQDFDIGQWPKITKKSQPQHIFDFYAQRLSDVFSASNARVNFFLVGACDGTHDKTIRDRFLPNLNWNGVFVEPIGMNFNDLNTFLEQNNATQRSFTIKAAVTNECTTPTVPVKVAKFEDKDPNLPHWLRREIGSILNKASDVDKLGNMWTVEEVPCKTASDLTSEWVELINQRAQADAGAGVKIKRRKKEPRIHVLKIDAEGHDFQVLSSFLRPDLPDDALPLMICFEAKSMHENLPKAREIMGAKGYIVSEGATNDGFALLRAKPAGDSGAVKGGAEGDRSGRDEKRKRKRKKKGSA